LQRGTPVALTDYAYLTTALIGAGIAFAVRFEGRVWDRLFPFVDARVERPPACVRGVDQLVGHGDSGRS